jgi:DNA-binding transcriptional ArsR family regulator
MTDAGPAPRPSSVTAQGPQTAGPATARGAQAAGPAPGPDQQAGSPGAHPTNGLDDTVHQRHRLGILTITAEARAEFGYLRGALGLTPGNLSRHLTVLEEAGLVQVEKGYQGRRPRTWVRITGGGRAALTAELAALTELVNRHRSTPVEQPGPA